jgi:hypothetical protein
MSLISAGSISLDSTFNIGIRRRLFDSTYLSLPNAALLVRAVIIKLTKGRERRIGDRWIRREGIGVVHASGTHFKSVPDLCNIRIGGHRH